VAEPVETYPRPATTSTLPIPTVIVDDVHVVYRVTSSGGRSKSPAMALRNLARLSRTKVRQVHAVKGVTLSTYQGQAIGLLGSNGSGKSTLLRVMAGLLPATRGVIYSKEQPTLLGVNAALQNDLSGERNVILGCLAMGMSRDEAYERCTEIIEFSGIDERGDFSSLPMRTYSSGMAARLRFALASAKQHEVLLIDEALSTGDAHFRRRAEERMRELRKAAGTVVLVSHATDSIRETCDRAIWLESGLIRMDGPTDEVVTAYEKFMKEK